jgi:hypothetical protein
VAVEEYEAVTQFEDWYTDYNPLGRRGDGVLDFRGHAPCAQRIDREYTQFKFEMDGRVSGYDVLEKLADAEVISPKPDLPNISSGETAGLIRRIARNLVQNTPNVEILSKFNDDKVAGIFSKHVLMTRIIGSDEYSNDMQQNLFSSTKTSLTIGFACVLPALLKGPQGWYIHYDTIHYRDVFPEPGVKDIRTAPIVFVRRYLTKGEVAALIKSNAPGWDVAALKLMMSTPVPNREEQSVSHQDKKHKKIPQGYEIITRYDSTGNPFLTFESRSKLLLRIEKNKHPLKQHPVHFLILEKDDQQPLGKSQVELLVGRQDFQDLLLNGAMKLWYRNINPSIIGYGTVNSIPNLSPGKYTQISNPNAKVEAFEVNTQTLMQHGQISQQNLAAMVGMIGAADQQMAQGSGAANGMSATPQGVEAQQQMVDITTNNYQKAIESFFSHYCSYALTLFFHELAGVKSVSLTADAREKLLEAGLDADLIEQDESKASVLKIEFEKLATEYWVRCIPGSLVEMEDEKQLRILNQLFIPLSQAMPALANSGDQGAIQNASKAMQYIIAKQIELSGSSSASDIGLIFKTGDVEAVSSRDQRIAEIEAKLEGNAGEVDEQLEMLVRLTTQQQEQMQLMMDNNRMLMEKLGVGSEQPAPETPTPELEAAPGVSLVS